MSEESVVQLVAGIVGSLIGVLGALYVVKVEQRHRQRGEVRIRLQHLATEIDMLRGMIEHWDRFVAPARDWTKGGPDVGHLPSFRNPNIDLVDLPRRIRDAAFELSQSAASCRSYFGEAHGAFLDAIPGEEKMHMGTLEFAHGFAMRVKSECEAVNELIRYELYRDECGWRIWRRPPRRAFETTRDAPVTALPTRVRDPKPEA